MSCHRPAAAEVGNAAQDSIGGMRVLVDNKALAAALPLAPQASASVPILLHACTVCRCELLTVMTVNDGWISPRKWLLLQRNLAVHVLR